KRELRLSDENGHVEISFRQVETNEEGENSLSAIRQLYGDPRTLLGLKKAQALMAARRHLEPSKAEAAVKIAQEALGKGHKVIFFSSRVHDSTSIVRSEGAPSQGGGYMEYEYSTESTVTALKKQLSKIGINETDIVEIHGDISKGKQVSNMARFQNGDAKIVIATMESGGVGINLDDSTGDAPRTMIILSAPFSAVENVQAIGRVWRLNTKSYPEIHYLVTPTFVDQWNISLIKKKMESLDAVIRSEVQEAISDEKGGEMGHAEEEYDPTEDNLERELKAEQEKDLPAYYDVTGNTFPAREALKRLGGRWNPEKKAWRVPGARQKDLEQIIEKHSGLTAKGVSGESKYQVQDKADSPEFSPITIASVESSFPGATVTKQDGGSFVVETPNGQKITVHPDATITMNKESASEAYGREMGDSDEAVGSFQSVNGEGVIRLTDKADQGTLDHETWHAAKALAISEEDAAVLKKDYANEEQEAEAYRQWVAGRRMKTTKRSGQIFQKILDFFSRIRA
ncbi:MAG: hypothetical protein EOM12_17475, partial [Verrucomicrobiae bacterium]|nr:hypothetical protein [Verrucomicrobiae bacterium]